ncbi:MAG: hypothetical protein J0H42_04230 [Rhizobiales bacterium]|nr:hypothetical protein [Hyphomicrobiales bacterium]
MSNNVTLPGTGIPVETIDPSTFGVTSATTSAGNALLTFASVPRNVSKGMVIANSTTPTSIAGGTTVLSKTATTVTMSANAAGAGVGNGDTITFTGGQRQRTSIGPADGSDQDSIGAPDDAAATSDTATGGVIAFLKRIAGRLTNNRPRYVSASFTQLVRPANVTPYSPNDSISNNSTAGSVMALSATVSDVNDDPVCLTELLLDTNDTGLAASVPVRAFLYNSDPTATSGVGAGDNATYSNKRAGYLGSMSGTFRAFSDGGKARLVPDEGGYIITKPSSGGVTVWIQHQTLNGFTPSANSTTIDGVVKGFQGRA